MCRAGRAFTQQLCMSLRGQRVSQRALVAPFFLSTVNFKRTILRRNGSTRRCHVSTLCSCQQGRSGQFVATLVVPATFMYFSTVHGTILYISAPHDSDSLTLQHCTIIRLTVRMQCTAYISADDNPCHVIGHSLRRVQVEALKERLGSSRSPERSTRETGDKVAEDQDPPREPPVVLPPLTTPEGVLGGHDPRNLDATKEERSKSGVAAHKVDGNDVNVDGVEIAVREKCKNNFLARRVTLGRDGAEGVKQSQRFVRSERE